MGRCYLCDYRLAEQSHEALAALLRSGSVEIVRQGQNAYGRTLMWVHMNGQDAGQYVVRQRLLPGSPVRPNGTFPSTCSSKRTDRNRPRFGRSAAQRGECARIGFLKFARSPLVLLRSPTIRRIR